MSSQFAIYVTRADMIDLGNLIGSVGEPFLIFETDRRNMMPTLFRDLAVTEARGLRISRQSDFDDVRWLPLRDGREYVDDLTSPVIEVSRSFCDQKSMTRGRLYYIHSYFDDRGRTVEKPDLFLKWASTVFRKVKGGLSYDKSLGALGTYVGPEAKAWLSEHEPYDVSPSGKVTTVVKRQTTDRS